MWCVWGRGEVCTGKEAIAQWARIPKKLAKIQSSTCCLFITFLFAKTSLSSTKKCDLVSWSIFNPPKNILVEQNIHYDMVATKLIINIRIYELYLQAVNLFFAARFSLH